MKNTLRRIGLIMFMASAFVQISACDDVKRILDSCVTDSTDGSTNVDCKP